MQNLTVMYWIPKKRKENPISFQFIKASLAGGIKPLSRDIS